MGHKVGTPLNNLIEQRSRATKPKRLYFGNDMVPQSISPPTPSEQVVTTHRKTHTLPPAIKQKERIVSTRIITKSSIGKSNPPWCIDPCGRQSVQPANSRFDKPPTTCTDHNHPPPHLHVVTKYEQTAGEQSAQHLACPPPSPQPGYTPGQQPTKSTTTANSASSRSWGNTPTIASTLFAQWTRFESGGVIPAGFSSA